jgi:hypothetical protein
MTADKQSFGELEPPDFTRQRDEASKEGVRGLLLINGGGSVALLAFLQAIWAVDKQLAKYVVIGIIFFAIGVAFAGVASFLRYHASFNFQPGKKDRWLLYRRGYIGCWYTSLSLFLAGSGVVVSGAWFILHA